MGPRSEQRGPGPPRSVPSAQLPARPGPSPPQTHTAAVPAPGSSPLEMYTMAAPRPGPAPPLRLRARRAHGQRAADGAPAERRQRGRDGAGRRWAPPALGTGKGPVAPEINEVSLRTACHRGVPVSSLVTNEFSLGVFPVNSGSHSAPRVTRGPPEPLLLRTPLSAAVTEGSPWVPLYRGPSAAAAGPA